MPVAAQRISRVLTLKVVQLQLILIHGCPLFSGHLRYFSCELLFLSTVAHFSPPYIHIHSVGLEACSESFCSLIVRTFTQLLKGCKVFTSIPKL